MKPVLLLISCLCVVLYGCSPKTKATQESIALSSTANELIIPWLQDFQEKSQPLVDHLERFCQNPSNQGELAASRDAWKETMLAWQSARIINFGPITDGNLAWRIQFWPDSHNRVGRKVNELLARDEAITESSLAESVVLVQGLSALEYVLFDPQNDATAWYGNPKTCEFLMAASSNSHSVANTLLSRWQTQNGNYLATFLSPGPHNAAYPSEQEAIGVLVGALVNTLEIMKTKKLAEPFGGAPGNKRFNPYKLELWRSQLSLTAMQTELQSAEQLFSKAIKPLLAKDHNALSQRATDLFKNLSTQLAAQSGPLFREIPNAENLQNWQTIWLELSELLGLCKREIPSALSLQLGFNANDGD